MGEACMMGHRTKKGIKKPDLFINKSGFVCFVFWRGLASQLLR